MINIQSMLKAMVSAPKPEFLIADDQFMIALARINRDFYEVVRLEFNRRHRGQEPGVSADPGVNFYRTMPDNTPLDPDENG